MLVPRRIQTIDFRSNGHAVAHLGEGWSSPEPDRRWTTGDSSTLFLPRPDSPADCLLQMTIEPCPGVRQRLTILVDGMPIAQLATEYPRTFCCRIPFRPGAPGSEMAVTFLHPDARRPADLFDSPDTRLLAFAFIHIELNALVEYDPGSAMVSPNLPDWTDPTYRGEQLLTPADLPHAEVISDADLMLHFESLGDSCEFGIVQRKNGAEPLGLLRFSASHMPNLLRGLDESFAPLAHGGALSVGLSDPPPGEPAEFIVTERTYNLVYHARTYVGEMTMEQVAEQERRKLPLVRRKFLEDLQSGRKICVRKQNDPISLSEMLPLWLALRRQGPNTLVWVVTATADHPPGSVERVMDGLLRGHVDRLAPYHDAQNVSLASWSELCRNAYALWRESKLALLDNLAA